jgi:hypothetical protein
VNKNTLKSIGAVLAGFVAVFVLSLGTDVVLHSTGVFPPWGERVSDPLLLLATVYRTVYCIAGSYVAARLAPNRPMAHALALGVVGLIASTAGALLTWNKGPAFGPHWYPVALIVTAIPCAWLGGRLRIMQLHTR